MKTCRSCIRRSQRGCLSACSKVVPIIWGDLAAGDYDLVPCTCAHGRSR